MKSKNQHYVNDCLLKALLIIQSLFVTQSVCALEATIGGLVYDLTGVSATVMHVAAGNTSSKIVIPETVEYQGLVYTVSAIGKKAFCNYKYDYYYVDGSQKWYSEGPHPFGRPNYYDSSSSTIPLANSYVREVVLPKTITTIGVGAFYNTNITNVELPEGVKTIGDYAFSRTFMVSITIPASVTSFGDYNIFYECDLLRTITYLGNMPPTKWVATSQTFVPNKTKYSTPAYSINSASIIPMIEWQDEEFAYNGSPHTAAWKNNMEGYTATLNMQALEKDAGSYTIDVPVTFTKGEDSFTADCTYSYKIKKSSLTVSADNATREYGADNPSLSFAFSGFVEGEDENVLTTKPTITTTATQNSPVGTYPITISGAESKNYDIVYESGTLTVTKAPLTVTVNDTTRTYGSQNPAFSVKYEGLKNGEATPAWTTGLSFSTDAAAKSNVGTYDVSLNCEAQNYDVSIRNGRLTITPATLTIKAEDASRAYCDDAPEYTFTCSGLVNGETVSVLTQLPLFSTDADQDSEVGAYSVTPYGASAPNYDIVYEGAMLNITKRQLTATVDNISRAYGDTNPAFTVSYSGFVNNETEDVLTKLPAVSSNAKPNSPVGTYPITLGGAESKNYDIVYEPGTLTVTKAPLTVTVNDTTRTYGSQNPAFSVRYEGLKNGEAAPAWTEKPVFTTSATRTTGVGVYPVTVDCEAKNYEVELVSGYLNVKAAPLTITASNASRLYYEDNPDFTYTFRGFVNNDNSSGFSKQPQIGCDATKDSKAGEYEIRVSGAEFKNYDIAYVNATLTITKRTLTVQPKDAERLYGEDNPAFEADITGYVNGETDAVLSNIPTIYTNATSTSNVGTYSILAKDGDADNYTFSYQTGTLTIEKADQTLTWEQDLSNIKVGDQVELLATSTSGLSIDYVIDSDIVSLYRVGKKLFLDCLAEGTFIIKAMQNGDVNYNPSVRMVKDVVITARDGVKSDAHDVNGDGTVDSQDVLEIYDYMQTH